MDLSSGRTFWDHTFSGWRYPILEEDIECDVLIIGSGSSGAHCAYFLSETDLSVVVVDQRDICSGSTKANTGLLQYSNDVMLSTLINSFGEEVAVGHYRLCIQAIESLQQKVVPSLVENSDFYIRKSLYFSSTEDDLSRLREEYYTLKKFDFLYLSYGKMRLMNFFFFKAWGNCNGL